MHSQVKGDSQDKAGKCSIEGHQEQHLQKAGLVSHSWHNHSRLGNGGIFFFPLRNDSFQLCIELHSLEERRDPHIRYLAL